MTTPSPNPVESLRALPELLPCPFKLPLEVESVNNEGNYGDGGPDCQSGFDSYQLLSADNKVICDTLNSDAIEVHEEYDEDRHHFWDEPGRQNMHYIAAAVNAYAAWNRRPASAPDAELLTALEDCANDLEAELKARYPATLLKYPSEQRKYERDMKPVLNARAILAKHSMAAEEGHG